MEIYEVNIDSCVNIVEILSYKRCVLDENFSASAYFSLNDYGYYILGRNFYYIDILCAKFKNNSLFHVLSKELIWNIRNDKIDNILGNDGI